MHSKFKIQRLLKGLTQYEIEKRTGIRQSTISLIERGFKIPKDYEKMIIAEVLDSNVNDLFTKENN